MSKGRTVDTSGTIDPHLIPLLESTTKNIQTSAQRNPITGFQDPYAKQVAGLSPYQKFAGQKIPGLTSPTTGDTLALQAIMRAQGLASRGPTVGEDMGQEPSLSTYRNAMNPYAGSWIADTPTGDPNYQDARTLGPAQNPPGEIYAPPGGDKAPPEPPETGRQPVKRAGR